MRQCVDSIDNFQMSGLKPIGSHMLKLILEYSKLAAALDTTRHHMSVNGVFIPQNHGTLFSLCLVLCSSSLKRLFSALSGNGYYREEWKVPMKLTTCKSLGEFGRNK